MDKIRIMVADDHAMFRAGLRSLIERRHEFHVIDEASDGKELLQKMSRRKCDIVLLDLSMPHMDGKETLERIVKRFPHVRVLVLTMQKDTSVFREAMSIGASGYVLKDDAFDQLVEAVETVARGEQFLSPSVVRLRGEEFPETHASASKRRQPAIDVLSKRELQVLKLVAAGLANKNIAYQLNISIRTVEAHRLNLMKKLNLRSTADVVRYTIENALE